MFELFTCTLAVFSGAALVLGTFGEDIVIGRRIRKAALRGDAEMLHELKAIRDEVKKTLGIV